MMSFMMGVVFVRKEGSCLFVVFYNSDRDGGLEVVEDEKEGGLKGVGGEREGEREKGRSDVSTNQQRTH